VATETPSSGKHSYYEEYFARLERQEPKLDDQLQRLVASAMTIRQFRDLLYAKDIDFDNTFVLSFVENTMKEDFNQVIEVLSNYRGDPRTGVREAEGLMNTALRKLYRIRTSLQEQGKMNAFKNNDIRVQAFLECRECLKKAYLQLEHLAKYFPPEPPAIHG